MGDENLRAATVLWAAGNEGAKLNWSELVETDAGGHIIVEPDLSLANYPHVFIAGDQANFSHQTGSPLPGTAPVALQ